MKKITHIRLGADPFPPYQFADENGQVVGIDCKTVTEVFKRAGCTVEVCLHDWPVVEEKLLAGSIDGAFQMQLTPEREKQWCFSKLLRNAVTEIITADPELRLASVDHISAHNLRLGVIYGYCYSDTINALPETCKVAYPDQESLLRAVDEGSVDAGVFDHGVRKYLEEVMRISGIRSFSHLDFVRPLHVIFTNPQLRDFYNAHA